MASTSVQKSFKYDVFLSFRGEDTRKNFVDHLHQALTKKGINTFKDDERIEKGEKISEQLIKSIENSRFYIIVFSKNYASSSWCLDELVKIMECQKTSEHTAYPVFYDVEPIQDDVDDIEQLEKLAGELTWYAIGKDIPNEGYKELSGKVVQYAAGLPLTVKLLGSHLCGRTTHEWVDAIERLKTIPLEKTLKRLELSYNGLNNDEKEIFLDVVCILKGEMRDEAIKILESCGFNAQIGLRVLEQKSLITISYTNCLGMHDHIEEMGWNIVRSLHPNDPSRHNRLWIKDEIEDILVNESGTEATRSMKLKNTNLHPSVIMKGLRKMKELRSLYMDPRYRKWEVDEGGQYLPDTLRSLYWLGYPFCCLPKTFQANRLVNLQMDWSNISELWQGGERKGLNKLRFLSLKFSKLRTFDLGMTPLLEKLDLRECSDFVKLHMHVDCPTLKYLNLSGTKVSNLDLEMTRYLEIIDLGGCSNFVKLRMTVKCPKLKFLDLSGSKVSNLDLRMTPCLETLSLRGCSDFVKLHMPVDFLNLKSLNLSGSKVSSLNLGLTPYLEKLDLGGCSDFAELHMPVDCPKLKSITLSGSKLTNINLGMTPFLETFDVHGCSDFLDLHMPVDCPKLKILDLSGSKVSNLNLGMTPHLKNLYLQNCSRFKQLYMPVECLNLEHLFLGGSKVSNLNLELTPNLSQLDLKGCSYLQEIHAPVGCLKYLVYLNLSRSSRFKYFHLDQRHGPFNLNDSLATLELIAESLDLCPQHPNNNLPKFQFRCIYDEHLPSSRGNLEKLISFGLCACTNLESFSASICGLQRLGELALEGSIPEVLKDLNQLESLKELSLSMKDIKHLPDSICMLKHLKCLELKSCWLLEQLPQDLGILDHLEDLYLIDCTSLRDIPNNICEIKCLERLHLPYCVVIEKLQEELGLSKRLKELNIEGTCISRLPQSIYQLKGLRIYGSRSQLESYGFTSLTEMSGYTAYCYI
ncbi:hypothetical protein QVD17_15798 [Tagetes erecta]|uniref:TIR domain-containing protein n=1 Tax=Tagetes erecta TaxID=13708 RepID=A0AAD8KPU2_TARER|nr:hypothetical protein QVD17_15798 [Tagetes erecta]